MPRITIEVTRPGLLGPEPTTGHLLWEPTRRNNSNTTVNLPTPMTITLDKGKANFFVEPSGPDWVWRVTELFSRMKARVTHYVVGTADIDYSQLSAVIPATLEPDANPIPVWWAVVQNLNIPERGEKGEPGVGVRGMRGLPGPEGPPGPNTIPTAETLAPYAKTTDIPSLAPYAKTVDVASSFVGRREQYINAKKDFGCIGDTRQVTDASVTSGSAIVTSIAFQFKNADIGKTLAVVGGGVAGALLIGIVQSINAANNTATLSVAASTTVTGRATLGTNDNDNLQAAKNAAIAAGKMLYLPKGEYLYTSNLDITGPLEIFGDGGMHTNLHAVGMTKAINITAYNSTFIRFLTLTGFGANEGIVYAWVGNTTSYGQGAQNVSVRFFTAGGFVVHNGEQFLFEDCVSTGNGKGYTYDVATYTNGTSGINCTWRRCRAIGTNGIGWDIDNLSVFVIEDCQSLKPIANATLVRIGGVCTGGRIDGFDIEDAGGTSNKTGLLISGSHHTIGRLFMYNLATGISFGARNSVLLPGNRYDTVTNPVIMAGLSQANNTMLDSGLPIFDPIVVQANPLQVTGNIVNRKNTTSGSVATTTASMQVPNGISLLICDATTAAVLINLPSNSNGREIRVLKKDTSTNNVLIRTPDGLTVVGTLNTQNKALTFVSDGTVWYPLNP